MLMQATRSHSFIVVKHLLKRRSLKGNTFDVDHSRRKKELKILYDFIRIHGFKPSKRKHIWKNPIMLHSYERETWCAVNHVHVTSLRN